MHILSFGEKAQYPEEIKYLRPVKAGSSRCADTRQSSLKVANTSSTSSEGNQMILAPSISSELCAEKTSAHSTPRLNTVRLS